MERDLIVSKPLISVKKTMKIPEKLKNLPFLSVGLVAEITGLTRGMIAYLAKDIPGAWQMPDAKKMWLIPNPDGINWILNRPRKKPGPKVGGRKIDKK